MGLLYLLYLLGFCVCLVWSSTLNLEEEEEEEDFTAGIFARVAVALAWPLFLLLLLYKISKK